jgi:large subunit ribosomal protein L18
MADIAKKRIEIRKSRQRRIRQKVSGTAERPRFCVRRSLGHVYAQIIDDVTGTSLVQVSSLSKDVKEKASGKSKSEVSVLVGSLIGEAAKAKGVESVVFDRGGYLYHGRVKALADAARESGLKF